MTQLFANAARGYLASAIGATDTTITLSGLGGLFTPVNSPDVFKGVLQDGTGFEIVYCTAHSSGSNTFTLDRGKEGTTARAFSAGSVFGQRLTALDCSNWNAAYGWGNHASAGYLAAAEADSIRTAISDMQTLVYAAL